MDSKAYNMSMVFYEDKKYCAEGSSCKCVDGNLFCSHMLACLAVVTLMQHDTSTFDELVQILPESVIAIQNIPCPFRFLLEKDTQKYK